MQATNFTSLLKFKAGKLTATKIDGSEKFKVEADNRKGFIELRKNRDETIHLVWADRTTGAVEDDLSVFPTGQKFTKVDTGRENDRVYLLEFTSDASRRYFFWMQEPDEKKDEGNCSKLNEYMTNPDAAQVPAGGNGTDRMDQQALMDILTGLNGGAGAGGSGSSDMMGNLNSILQGMGLPLPEETSNSTSSTSNDNNNTSEGNGEAKEANSSSTLQPSQAAPAQEQPNAPQQSLTPEALRDVILETQNALQGMRTPQTPALTDIFSAEEALSILDDKQVQDALLPLLPEGSQTVEELRYAVGNSPQIRQALAALSMALHSDNFNLIMANFQLNPMDGATALSRGDAIGAFLDALQSSVKDKTNGGGGDDVDDFYN